MSFQLKAITASLLLASSFTVFASGGTPATDTSSGETTAPSGGANFNFYVTGDPQYFAYYDEQRNKAESDRTLGAIGSLIKANTAQNRGLLVAGDLTQQTRPNNEFAWYESAISSFKQYVYDGQGNHDDEDAEWYNAISCPLLDNCQSSDMIIDAVRERSRDVPVKLHSEGTVYSWDWEGVHFVQLGTYPGDSAYNEGWASHVDPYTSLSFLKSDLANNVGNSGRPVVLVFHYEFQSDAGDGAAWSHEQIKSFWNALGNYNVKVIFSGHVHYGNGGGWVRTVNRPSGASSGPNSVTNIVAGAALNSIFVKAKVRDNVMKIERYEVNSSGSPVKIDNAFSISLD